jgi:hypothetical protein
MTEASAKILNLKKKDKLLVCRCYWIESRLYHADDVPASANAAVVLETGITD